MSALSLIPNNNLITRLRFPNLPFLPLQQSQNTAQIPVKKPVASQPLYDGFSSDDDSPYKPAVRQPQRAGRRTTKAQGPAGPKPARAITTTSVFDKLGINESGFESDSSAGNSPFQGKGRMVSALEGLPAALSPLPVASPFDQLQGRLARANSTIAALEQEVAVSTHRSEEAMKELQEATEKIQKLEVNLVEIKNIYVRCLYTDN